MEHKVACPQCAAPLRSAKPIPAGMRIKCPRCGLQFSTPHANGVGDPHIRAVGPAGAVPAAAAAVQAAPPAAASAISASAPPGVGMPRELPSPQAPAGRGARLALLGGGAALLAVGVVVA